ncbi:hypothetical protein [Natronorarus salvus]|uniref:hypothetical protein n=1 Tax=Natronorarus salvus TaxID=3117733 RepID=UPI002F26449A
MGRTAGSRGGSDVHSAVPHDGDAGTGQDDDPRLQSRYVRRIDPDDRAPITLVGVVHDHPASVHRVRSIVGRLDPDVLALELPPLALGLYRLYADPRFGPDFGGEMSAALAAGARARPVGMDGPSRRFYRHLAAALGRRRPDSKTLSSVVSETLSASAHAVACAAARPLCERTPLAIRIGSPRRYDCSPADTPSRQAHDEERQVRAATALAASIDAPARDTRDAARDACMADAILDTNPDESVVAVVGVSHLDPLSARLRAA